ncbi:MAG: DUF6285 domain-containing protein [Myxococcota bacterium]|jgi:hypothetical protein|nr:DUF6285 domain-containing protein [Myxococcota bacterium]
MNDRPDARELLEAVRRFLADEAVPALGGHLGYQARVAANVVGIVAREIEFGPDHLEREWRGLAALLETPGEPPREARALDDQIREGNEVLCQRIRAGEADAGPWRESLVAHLQAVTEQKLAVARGIPRERGPGRD